MDYFSFPLCCFLFSFAFLKGFFIDDHCNPNAGTGMGAAAVFERGDCTDELCNARISESNRFLSKDAR